MFNRHLLLATVCGVCLTLGLQAQAKPPSRASEEEDQNAQPRSNLGDATRHRQIKAEGVEAWGYIDVRPGAHSFYWLYETYHQGGAVNRPLVIWLQGGPGGSSCGYGNFEIIGPLDLDLKPRNTTWVNEVNVLFIDNPVGAGYSYVDDDSLFTTDVQQITDDLMTLTLAFMDLFPKFRTVPIYVFGQSYGGKMGAHFARQLYYEQQAGRADVNVVGFAMGNSWISPVDSTMTWGPLLYQMSLVDENGYDAIQAEAQLAKDAVEAGEWELATDYWASTEWVVIDKTHGVDFYNILKFVDYWSKQLTSSQEQDQEVKHGLALHAKKLGLSGMYLPSAKAVDPLDELMNGPIREKLGIIPPTVVWGAQSDAVFNYQTGDFMKPVVDVVDEALINTTLQVIIYQGQLDLICDNAGAMDWVQQLQWSNLNDYNTANRQWFVNEQSQQTEMYVKAHDRFKYYWVLGAGHAVPKDNGETALRMLQRIINNDDV